MYEKRDAYLFTSERLGFRTWDVDRDVDAFARLCADEQVMKYFPSTLTKEETRQRLVSHSAKYEQFGYCYFPVELRSTGDFIGFIGLDNSVGYDTEFSPYVDIGWRLNPKFWRQGYATEGALRTLAFGFEECDLDSVYALTSHLNIASEAVMQRIGMQRYPMPSGQDFHFPSIDRLHWLQPGIVYRILAEDYFATRDAL